MQAKKAKTKKQRKIKKNQDATKALCLHNLLASASEFVCCKDVKR